MGLGIRVGLRGFFPPDEGILQVPLNQRGEVMGREVFVVVVDAGEVEGHGGVGEKMSKSRKVEGRKVGRVRGQRSGRGWWSVCCDMQKETVVVRFCVFQHIS